MPQYVLANNINTTLASGASATATTLTLASAANLPTGVGPNVMPLTLNDAATQSVYEIVYVTAINGANLTVLRGQEGTTAQTWLAGDYAYCALTAGIANEFIQSGAEPGSGLVVLDPPQAQTGGIELTGSVTSGSVTTGAITGTTGSFSSGVQASNGTAQSYVAPVFNADGTAYASSAHIVTGSLYWRATTTANSWSSTVTLTGAAVFQNGFNVYCSMVNSIIGSNSPNGTSLVVACGVQSTGNSFTITIATADGYKPANTGEFQVLWVAIGS